MSTAISKPIPRGSDGASPSQGPPPLELIGPFLRVPSLEELERLTAIPDRRVVYRGVDWSFYEQLVDSIPESSKIHVDYDGKDLEVMGIGPHHGWAADTLGFFVKVVAGEAGDPPQANGRDNLEAARDRSWSPIRLLLLLRGRQTGRRRSGPRYE